ncbi:Sensor histidine kinase [Chitinispirillum alkaliphilum]|nr:Sensor histidine kinase [Chitinispirillum alkaliphilum]
MKSVGKGCAKILPENNPVRSAAVSALIYVLLAVVYIIVSSRVAGLVATSTEQYQRIEIIKGIIYVGITGFFFFLISYGWWRKVNSQRILLVNSEKREFASKYSSVLTHDLNNLLMGLWGVVYKIKDQSAGDIEMKDYEALERATSNLARFSKRLTSAYKSPQKNCTKEVDISPLFDSVIEFVMKHPDVRKCEIIYKKPPHIISLLDVELFEQCVMNLVVNAAQATGEGGIIEVTTNLTDDMFCFGVHDNGPGIPCGEMENIFDAGFTTKTDGSGLGLMSVQAFAASYGGEVKAGKSHLGGAVFSMRIPICNEYREGMQNPGLDSSNVGAQY